MRQSREQFVEHLYEECLEDAGFLYEQRGVREARPGLALQELVRREQRSEALLEALALGGTASAELCMARLSEADEGAWYITARLLSRLGLQGQLLTLLGRLSASEPARVVAVREGLCHEAPSGTLPALEKLPDTLPPEVLAALATVLGHYREGGKEWLLERLRRGLEKGAQADTPRCIWALARLRVVTARGLLRSCLQESQSPAVRTHAALALVRLGEARVAPEVLSPQGFPLWACLPVALVGSARAVPRLRALVREGNSLPELCLALALMGDPSAVPELQSLLEQPPAIAAAAAQGLELLTGARLLHPRRLGSSAPSEVLGRWRSWWSEHRGGFVEGARYRFGRLLSPELLLQELRPGAHALALRQLMSEELALRYALEPCLEPDGLVRAQLETLRQGQEWLSRRIDFAEGHWYLQGHLQS